MASSPEVFQARRQRLSALLARRGVETAAFCSGWARPRNFAHNVFPFRAESHFLYLVGRHLEGAVLLLQAGRSTLFVTPQPAEMALWEGPLPGPEELAALLELDVRPLDDLEAPDEAACLPPQDEESALWFESLLDRAIEAQSGPQLVGLDAQLADAMVELRLVHDEAAIAELRAAAEISAQAHVVGMRSTRGASHEYVVRGAMEGAIVSRGLRTSYTSIVSTRGEILHNNDSNGRIAGGELLLCDVGAESLEGWAGDITRTWPTNGRFSPAQRDVYSLVLAVQKAAIVSAVAGVRYLELHRQAGHTMGEGLVELGLLRGEAGDLYERGAVAVFFPHGLGHLLGLDVHDMEDLGDRAGYDVGAERSTQPGESALRLDRRLAADQVVTIEPGFYQSPLLLERARLDPRVRDAVVWERLPAFADVRGIRIEDDVRITSGAAQVLSASAPKEIDALETILR